jgi:hypothetical protein
MFLTAVAVAFLALPAAADEKDGTGDLAADPCNSRLAVQVGSDGRFNIGAFPDETTCGATVGSWDIMYRWPYSPWSSFSTVRVDGSDNVYGSSGVQIEAPTDVNATTNRSKWQMGDIEATQALEIVFNNQTGETDVAKITYTVRNTGSVPHDVGIRTMIDTELNYNDGAPFRVPGVGAITTEMEFVGASVPDTFQVFFDLTDAAHVAAGTLKSGGATPPERFVIARWPGIYGTTWDYTTTPGSSITADSAYAAYWNPAGLNPGESRTYVTYYGLAEVNIDLEPPLALGVSGPAALSVVDGQYSPNPFDVVATVFNNGTATATDVHLTLSLPAGLSLASGSLDQAIGDLAVGQERQVSWSVLAAAQSTETTLTYSVTAAGSNTEPKTLERQVTVPALIADSDGFSFAIITDLHIGRYREYDGEEYYLTQRLWDTVNWINQEAESRNIKFVAVLGDISNDEEVSADDHLRQLNKAKTILSHLTIPYVPVIGNHDIWHLTDVAGSAALFHDVFDPVLAELPTRLPGVKDVNTQCGSGGNEPLRLHNFTFTYRGLGFAGLDFVSRAGPGRAWALGVAHEATLDCLGDSLALHSFREESVVILAHHPLLFLGGHWPWRSLACFPYLPFRAIAETIAGSRGGSTQEVVSFGGHMHGYSNSPAGVFNANYGDGITPAGVGIPVVITEAVMVGPNQKEKGFVRIVEVEEDGRIYVGAALSPYAADQPAFNPYMECRKSFDNPRLPRFAPRPSIQCTGYEYSSREAAISSWDWDFNGDGLPDGEKARDSDRYFYPGDTRGQSRKVCLTVRGEGAQEKICNIW